MTAKAGDPGCRTQYRVFGGSYRTVGDDSRLANVEVERRAADCSRPIEAATRLGIDRCTPPTYVTLARAVARRARGNNSSTANRAVQQALHPGTKITGMGALSLSSWRTSIPLLLGEFGSRATDRGWRKQPFARISRPARGGRPLPTEPPFERPDSVHSGTEKRPFTGGCQRRIVIPT